MEMQVNQFTLNEHDEAAESQRTQRLYELKVKSNLQLIEAIRMDARMMHLRLNDILSKENNIYLMLAKEKEKNAML